jgi:hypothetical protein
MCYKVAWRFKMNKNFIFIIVLFALLSGSEASFASTARNLTYSESIVWRCAVRFIRVDSGFKIIEKDKDAGYMLFEYRDGGMVSNGSIEVLKITKEDKKLVRVQINVAGQPSYIESLLFTKLQRKLKHEYGFPPEAVYVSHPVDMTGKSKVKDNTAGGSSGDESEDDLEITEDDLNENVE